MAGTHFRPKVRVDQRKCYQLFVALDLLEEKSGAGCKTNSTGKWTAVLNYLV